MSVVATPAYEWRDLDWRAIEKRVYRLQKRIYHASGRGDVKAVHKLQRLLMKSWSARCLATRKVTQDNRGKKTAGVDGVKNLSPVHRVLLVELLREPAKAKPTRRVWIPKPGAPTEKRGLGIPVMRDRAEQALAKLALEPEWEAKFEPNSYGFRPGRSCHDAIGAIFNDIRQQPKYVLDADIAGCFNNIAHTALLDKLGTYPTLRRAIKGWLKAGVMDGLDLTPTDKGTPQGGVASPLLANVALHGLETTIRAAFPAQAWVEGTRRQGWKPHVVRYADDFVILHENLAVIERCRQITTDWLAGMGLELKPSKTTITHTLHEHEGQIGFDFLGFAVRQFVVGKHRTKTDGAKRPLGYKTIIKPSADAQRRHLRDTGRLVRQGKSLSQGDLIGRLNRRTRGWVNYYSTVASAEVFHAMDRQVYTMLRRWARRRHPQKSSSWVAEKYWHIHSKGHWEFGVDDGPRLYKHAAKGITRHIKVQGTRSFFDGDRAYWATRLGRHPEISGHVATLLKLQKGRCTGCGLLFTMEDVREVDHITPRTRGGEDGPMNTQLLHGHCHDAKTAGDGTRARGGIRVKDQGSEEPCTGKLVSTVLKAGGHE